MARYLMRSWETRTLRAHEDYEVEAASEAEAARLLADAQVEAQDDGDVGRVVGVRRVLCHGPGRARLTEDGVKRLDPDEPEDAELGITLLDGDGGEIREAVDAAGPVHWFGAAG